MNIISFENNSGVFILSPEKLKYYDEIRIRLEKLVILGDIRACFSPGKVDSKKDDFSESSPPGTSVGALKIPVGYFAQFCSNTVEEAEFLVYCLYNNLFSLKSGPAQIGLDIIPDLLNLPQIHKDSEGKEYFEVNFTLMNHSHKIDVILPEEDINFLRFFVSPFESIKREDLQAMLPLLSLPPGSNIVGHFIEIPITSLFLFEKDEVELETIASLSARNRNMLDRELGLSKLGDIVLPYNRYPEMVLGETGEVKIPEKYCLVLVRKNISSHSDILAIHSSSVVLDSGFIGTIRTEVHFGDTNELVTAKQLAPYVLVQVFKC